MSIYDVYYCNQIGGGGRGVNHVYAGAPRMRGHGLGSWFSGIFRSALPLLTKGARAVGKEALRASVNMLDDVTENNTSFKDSFNHRINESGQNLKRKATDKLHKLMDGSGYYPLHVKHLAQSRHGNSTRRTFRVKKRCAKEKTKKKKKKRSTRVRTKVGVKSKNKKNPKKKTSAKRKTKKSKSFDIFG